MSNCITFQTQVAAIMDVLAKAAVAEISKLAEEDTVVLRLEMCRRENEIEGLKLRLQMTERDLRKAHATARTPANRCSVGIQVESPPSNVRGVMESGAVSRLESQFRAKRDPKPPQELKEETPQLTHSVEQNSQLTHTTELSQQHGPRYSDEELSGLEFEMKAEQEEEHVAQRLNHTGSEYGTGEQNHLDCEPECGMDERDTQLWSSITEVSSGRDSGDPDCSYGAEQHSQVFPSHAELYPPPTVMMEGSSCSLSIVDKSHLELFSAMPIKEECEGHSESVSESSQPEQGQHTETLSPVIREELILQPRQQPYGAPHTLLRAKESAEHVHTHTHSALALPLSHSHVNNTLALSHPPRAEGFPASRHHHGFRTKPATSHRRADTHHPRVFICSVCGKSFFRFCQLEAHQRSHTGVKPYRCGECGKRFTQKTRLKTHQSVHTGERPYSCKLCGKMFSRQDNCIRHERFHSGQKPYSCSQCGKSFTVLSNLKIHMQLHS